MVKDMVKYWIVKSLFFNQNFKAAIRSSLLSLYWLVCVRPGQKSEISVFLQAGSYDVTW